MRVIRDAQTSPTPCVATIGFFDGVHRGHRFLIDKVKAIACTEGYQSAVLTFPIAPRKVMNSDFIPCLLTTYEEKIRLLSETGIDNCIVVDFTRELSGYSAQRFMEEVLLKRYGVRHLIVGYDHRFGHNRAEGLSDYIAYGKAMGMKVEPEPAYQWSGCTISSSIIRKMISDGDVAAASSALSYSYFVEGTVVGGRHIGHEIGFPTANVHIDNSEKLVPARGVYAVLVEVEGTRYQGMLNIGLRPTLQNGDDVSIEVHIFDFEEDIYGLPIRLTFLDKIRDEQKFNSLHELEAQLRQDEIRIRSIINTKE